MKTPYFVYYTSTKTGMMYIIDFLIEQGIEINDYESIVYKRSKISNICKSNEELILYNFGFETEEEEEEFEKEEKKEENNDNDN